MSESLDEKIRKQLEFYFGDSNLSRDRFLRQQIDGSEEGCKKKKKQMIFNLN